MNVNVVFIIARIFPYNTSYDIVRALLFNAISNACYLCWLLFMLIILIFIHDHSSTLVT